MIRPIQSGVYVSHVYRNLGTVSQSVHRAVICDYSYKQFTHFIWWIGKFIYGCDDNDEACFSIFAVTAQLLSPCQAWELVLLDQFFCENSFFSPLDGPCVMSLIFQKTNSKGHFSEDKFKGEWRVQRGKTIFKGECRVQHEHFRPFLNDKYYNTESWVLFLSRLRRIFRSLLFRYSPWYSIAFWLIYIVPEHAKFLGTTPSHSLQKNKGLQTMGAFRISFYNTFTRFCESF